MLIYFLYALRLLPIHTPPMYALSFRNLSAGCRLSAFATLSTPFPIRFRFAIYSVESITKLHFKRCFTVSSSVMISWTGSPCWISLYAIITNSPVALDRHSEFITVTLSNDFAASEAIT